jgi:hypothetical protein
MIGFWPIIENVLAVIAETLSREGTPLLSVTLPASKLKAPRASKDFT